MFHGFAERFGFICLLLLLTALSPTAGAGAQPRHRRSAASSVVSRAEQSSAASANDIFSVCHSSHATKPLDYMQFAVKRAKRQQQQQTSLDRRDGDSAHELFEWCRRDAECCRSYYLLNTCIATGSGSGSNDTTDNHHQYELDTFLYMIRAWHEPSAPLTELLDKDVCNTTKTTRELLQRRGDGDTDENVMLEHLLRHTWVTELRLRSAEGKHRVRCTADGEHYVYSPTTNEGHCQCIDMRSNSECRLARMRRRQDPVNYSLVAILVASVAATLLLIGYLIELVLTLRIYAQITRESDTKKARDMFQERLKRK